MLKFIFLLLIFGSTKGSEGCSSHCRMYTYKLHSDRTEILDRLLDKVKINELALIGTRLSAVKRYQDLSISDQLKYGVRVLDISVRATSDKFAIHHKSTFQNQMFGDILNKVDEFLHEYPGELVIMLLDEVYYAAEDVTKSNCDILKDYMRWGWRMVNNWSLDDNLEMHRGAILLGTIKDNSFKKCIVDLNPQCLQSSELKNKYRPRPNEISEKYREMTTLQEASFRVKNFKCFINIIGSYGYDEHTARYVALRGSGWFHLTCKEPINYTMANYFMSPSNALIIMLADFPTQELIDRVNDQNYNISF